MDIGAIIQVRMSSIRLPGKTLYRVDNKSLLQYLVERLEHCIGLDKVVVATSGDPSDTPIETLCREKGWDVFRGDLFNVAKRFIQVLDKYIFNAFVRVNGDSPLIDQHLIEKGISLFKKGAYDLVTNVQRRSYPQGQSVEVISTKAFRNAFSNMKAPEELEHVTKYFYDHHNEFRIHNFSTERLYSGIKLSVDTPEDMENFKKIVTGMEKLHWEYSLDEIVELLKGPGK